MLISNLLTQQPALDNEVYVFGYATPGDGGGGFFAWKTTAELPAGAAANTGIFNDCGPVSGGGVAIYFAGGTAVTPCSSDFICFDQNIFLTPTGRTLEGIKKYIYHNFTPRNNRFINNQFNGLSSAFEYINDNNFGLATGIIAAITVLIPHNLGSIPVWASVQAQSTNVPDIKNITVDSTNIIVTFTALPVGSVNLFWSVQA